MRDKFRIVFKHICLWRTSWQKLSLQLAKVQYLDDSCDCEHNSVELVVLTLVLYVNLLLTWLLTLLYVKALWQTSPERRARVCVNVCSVPKRVMPEASNDIQWNVTVVQA